MDNEQSNKIQINYDQQAWIKSIVMSAMTMAVVLDRSKGTRQDTRLIDEAVFGLSKGALYEIAVILNMSLETPKQESNKI